MTVKIANFFPFETSILEQDLLIIFLTFINQTFSDFHRLAFGLYMVQSLDSVKSSLKRRHGILTFIIRAFTTAKLSA